MGLLQPGRKDTDTNLSSLHLHTYIMIMIVNVNVFGFLLLDRVRANKDQALIVFMYGDLSEGKTNLFKERLHPLDLLTCVRQGHIFSFGG